MIIAFRQTEIGKKKQNKAFWNKCQNKTSKEEFHLF